MKKASIILLIINTFGFATVIVDGYALLENQTTHDSIQIVFERTAPSSLLDTAYTATDGSYTIQLETGIYNVTYTKDGYFSELLTDQSFYANTTLSSLTLLEHTTLINVPSLFSTIQTAIKYAFNGDTVLVQPGTYVENINYNGKNIVVGSLFLTTQDTSFITSTIIDGNQNGSVVIFENEEDETAVLIGFTITNGYSVAWPQVDGGGIFCNNSNPSLVNVIITNNSAYNGGGIACHYSSPNLINVKITNNSAISYGGGILCKYNSSPNLINVKITNNSVNLYGGGICCEFSANPSLVNVTITNNSAGATGGGIACYSSSSPSLVNAIISSNTGQYGIYSNDPINLSITYSDIYDNESDNFYNVGDLIGVNVTTNANGDSCDAYYNIQADPLFVDTANGDYNLQQGSPCVDAGDPSSPYDPDGSIADMGALPSAYGTRVPVVINVPTDYTTIQAALTAAIATDTVLVQPGTYTENIIWPETNGIKLISAGDSSNTIIDGGGNSYVIYLLQSSNTIDTLTVISGFKIQNWSTDGNGIITNDANPTLSNLFIYGGNVTSGTGIKLSGTSLTLIKNCYLKNLSYGIHVYTITGNNSYIKDNIIRSCQIAIKIDNNRSKKVTIQNNIIETNVTGIWSYRSDSDIFKNICVGNGVALRIDGWTCGSGGVCNGVSPYVFQNIIAYNTNALTISSSYSVYEENIFFENSGEKLINLHSDANGNNYSTPTFINNSFQNNDAIYSIYNGEGNVTAENNWWGTTSIDSISTMIYDSYDNVNMGLVDYEPILSQPYLDGPLIPAHNITLLDNGNDYISLNWKGSSLGDLAGYKLYYDSDSSGYPYTNSIDIGTDTSYTLSGLILSTTYYLAVTTYDTDGNESWYSKELTGTTRVIQVQNLDVGGDEDLQHMVSHTPSITFRYYDSANETQTTYQIQVSTDSLFSSANMWDSGTITSSDTSATYAGTTLEDGVTYYARAKVGAGTFYSSWSNLSFRMNTEPTTPVLVSPINNQVSGTPVVLKVLNATDAESDAITYSYNLYSDIALTTKLDSTTAVTEGTDTTSWQITATLPDNGQYFWTVSTNDGYEESTVSDAGSFLLNIANDAPATFALTYPADTSEVTTTLPTLLWQVSTDSDPIDTVRYMVQFGSTIPDLESFYTDTMTSYQFTTELDDNTDYFWRVIAEDLNGASTENTGGYHSFRVNTANDLPGDFALISPEDESIVTDITPTLYWEVPVDPDDRSRSIVSYHVYLDNSLTGTFLDTVTINNYTAPTLLEDAMYYWWIVAVDDDGGIRESTIWSFWTNSENSVPSPFTLLTPTVDEETGLTPTFSWTASSDADLYDVIGYTLSYGSDPTSLTDVSTNGDLTYTPATTLMDNTDYVWQVTATDQSGATHTTELQSFTVNSANDDPGVFSLISPDSGSVVLELPPLLVWSPTTDLDGDSVLFDIQLNGTSIGMTHHNYYFVDGLAEDMTYTWSVTATDNNGGSTQSGTWSFIVNTENVPPTPFALLSPEAETVLSTQSVFFEWEISTDPDPMDSVTYGLDVHTDTTHMHFEINTTSFTSEAFMDNRVYNWSVTAHDMNGGVTENIGGPRMFVINVENDPPTASTLVAPLNESIQTDLTPNFYWTEANDPDPMDHVSYTMNWWPMGMLPVIYSTDTDSNSFTPEDNLTDNSQFGWMVTANDMHDAQSNSDSSYFYTDAFPEPPLNFATITPENNAEGIATEVEFVWNETDDPDPVEELHYQLVYATDWQDSSTYVYSDLIEDTSLTLTLEDNSQYYWIVVAMDTDGFMVGSNDNTPNTMVVGTLSIDGADIPEVFALHQNYPNPFNPTTTLKYDLPEDAMVNITIYDMMGRVVKTMVSSQQSAGFKSVRWNATNDKGSPVSAGLYLYTIQAGEFRQTKKMVLLK